jgi:hypothetical protein
MPTIYRLTRAEQETILRWDRETRTVHVWSADPVTWRKLARLGIPPTRETHLPGGVPSGRFYTIPLVRFSWGLKRAGTSDMARRLHPRIPRSPQGRPEDATSRPSDGRPAISPLLELAGVS